jgi:hypothetical protein
LPGIAAHAASRTRTFIADIATTDSRVSVSRIEGGRIDLDKVGDLGARRTECRRR